MNREEAGFEVEYWKQVLRDVNVINDEVLVINEAIIDIGVKSLELVTSLWLFLDKSPKLAEIIDGEVDRVKEIQASLQKILPAVNGIAEMADGRSKAIRKALGDAS